MIKKNMFNFFKTDIKFIDRDELIKMSIDELLNLLINGNISKSTGNQTITIIAERLHERVNKLESQKSYDRVATGD